jgi:hypothetical protein
MVKQVIRTGHMKSVFIKGPAVPVSIIMNGNNQPSVVPNRSKKRLSPTDRFSPDLRARMWLSACSSQTSIKPHPTDWNPMAFFPHWAQVRFSAMVVFTGIFLQIHLSGSGAPAMRRRRWINKKPYIVPVRNQAVTRKYT